AHSWSQRSFSGLPAWPFTHRHSITCWSFSSSSLLHNSSFLSAPVLRAQLRFFHWGSHSVMPFLTYSESVCRTTWQGVLRDSRARMAAVSSMRLLVVFLSPPEISRRCPSKRSTAPQPPVPGLGSQPPSVYIVITGLW